LDDSTEKVFLVLTRRLLRDSLRIERLERQLKTLRIRLYILLGVTFVLAIASTLIMARMLWHLRP
jgi:hypothetical protein